MSHPSWVCGLKHGLKNKTSKNSLSHPSWVCGLKPLASQACMFDHLVTPFVGVWIETQMHLNYAQAKKSHPSWVCGLKLSLRKLSALWLMSHPSWVCGLKLFDLLGHNIVKSHTLRGCVDWNSKSFNLSKDWRRSHPSWVCGLKHSRGVDEIINRKSHPSWVCGLKHSLSLCGAWMSVSHPSWVCGLKRKSLEHFLR